MYYLGYDVGAQTVGVIVDMETHLPVHGAQIYTNTNLRILSGDSQAPVHGAQIYTNTNRDVSVNSSGHFIITVPFSSVTVSATGYMKRTLAKSEMRDTIFLMPHSISLHEVVVTTKRPTITMPINQMARQVTRGYPPPSGHDFLSIFEKHRVTAKQRKQRSDAIADY